LIKQHDELKVPKIYNPGSDLYAVTWIRLQANWIKEPPKKSRVERNWFIESYKISTTSERRPKYIREFGNNAPDNISWKSVTYEFLSKGFGDTFMNAIKTKNQQNWEKHYKNNDKYSYGDIIPVDTIQQIDCSKKYCTYNLQSYQICGIMWSDKEDCYKGMYMYEFEDIQKSNNGKYRTIQLDENWVKEQYGNIPGLLELIKEKSGNKRPFVSVPPGRSSKRKKKNEPVAENLEVKYRQEENNTCLCDALASALHFIGITGLAETVHEYGRTHLATPNFYDELDSVLFSNPIFRRTFNSKRLGINQYDIENDRKKKGIFLITLCGDDGSQDHVISIVDEKIFDPNSFFAMDLTKQNLDSCCGEGNTCIGIREGRHYYTHFHERKGLI